MRTPLIFVLLGALFLIGCSAGDSERGATNISEHFSEAPPEEQRVISEAENAVRAKKYEDAVRGLNRVAAKRKLSGQQRQALIEAYEEILTTIDQDPSLDSPGLYRAMAELSHRLHGEN